ncbi:peptidoglycan DD-metalloendopeptidase family protein [Paenibacillus sp. J5C_2022]|uniref:peptidoglycan DD-metalloendopeptidase family protein n=1 Tax=Paenibacillus sp. J5C2022 TaxID=2977129 RepID=UPI0021D1DA23|nr:peptidoglycan DD-metalloendopeptidase family protein [Paenibacillus sp. J5C2022]MCU6709192.1 peptidoglycan DD-metalloendopeptidase family protein [Paenibacillus sp. J5C2022]
MRRARNPSWSFVVMRGADKSVKQFSVSRRSVVVAPVAAVLAVTGCVVGLQMKAAYELRSLENRLETQSAQYAQAMEGKDSTITEKDHAIAALQQELEELMHQAQALKEKMTELNELELKLKAFIEKYGSSVNIDLEDSEAGTNTGYQRTTAPRVQTLSASSTRMNKEAAVTPYFRDAVQIASYAQDTSLDLKELSLMVDAMEQSMAQTLRQAQHKRRTVDAFPSKWPTVSKRLTSGFGYRKDPFTGSIKFHAGIDIQGKSGDTVFSAADGVISDTGYDRWLGHYIIIDHLTDLQSVYMHLKQIDARIGDEVVKGERIGLLGSSGRSTGPHLHFQIMQKNEPVNPLEYIAHRS